MPEHPIEGLMKTTLDSIRQMIDVNTILGDPVETQDGNVIMPVSRVAFGFASGGTQWSPDRRRDAAQPPAGASGGVAAMPFGGGAGAGVSLNPVGFLVVGNNQVRFLPVTTDAIFDRLIDVVPDLIARLATPQPKTITVKTQPQVETKRPMA
ncbi:MAG: GerW family sporulation protein [Bacillota bacterium]